MVNPSNLSAVHSDPISWYYFNSTSSKWDIKIISTTISSISITNDNMSPQVVSTTTNLNGNANIEGY